MTQPLGRRYSAHRTAVTSVLPGEGCLPPPPAKFRPSEVPRDPFGGPRGWGLAVPCSKGARAGNKRCEPGGFPRTAELGARAYSREVVPGKQDGMRLHPGLARSGELGDGRDPLVKEELQSLSKGLTGWGLFPRLMHKHRKRVRKQSFWDQRQNALARKRASGGTNSRRSLVFLPRR